MSRKPPRERVIYEETYRRGALKLLPEVLPELKHVSDEGERFKATECHILRAGRVQLPDGTEREYQDLRVYFEMVPS